MTRAVARRLQSPLALVALCGAMISCSGSNSPVYTDRASNLTTFTSVAGTITVRWSGGTADYGPVPSTDGSVAPGTCSAALFGDVQGRVDHPDTFVAQPGRIMIGCRGAEGSWQLLVVTDNVTRAQSTDVLKFEPEIRGPTIECRDTTTSVTGSVTVLEAVGDVDVRTVSVPANFFRRLRIIAESGASSCGLDGFTIDVTGEINADTLNFSEARGSLKE